MEQLAWDGFAVVTSDLWKKLIRHVKQYTQPFVIEFRESDSDSDMTGPQERSDWGTSVDEFSLQRTYTAGSDDSVSDGGNSEEESRYSCDYLRWFIIDSSFLPPGFSKSHNNYKRIIPAQPRIQVFSSTQEVLGTLSFFDFIALWLHRWLYSASFCSSHFVCFSIVKLTISDS